MKQQDNKWKKAVLHNFEKPTHQGFTEDVMQNIERQQQPARPAPLISPKQWLFAGVALGLIIFITIISAFKWDADFDWIQTYSGELSTFLNEQTSLLWIAFSLTTVFFVYLLFSHRKGRV